MPLSPPTPVWHEHNEDKKYRSPLGIQDLLGQRSQMDILTCGWRDYWKTCFVDIIILGSAGGSMSSDDIRRDSQMPAYSSPGPRASTTPVIIKSKPEKYWMGKLFVKVWHSGGNQLDEVRELVHWWCFNHRRQRCIWFSLLGCNVVVLHS